MAAGVAARLFVLGFGLVDGQIYEEVVMDITYTDKVNSSIRRIKVPAEEVRSMGICVERMYLSSEWLGSKTLDDLKLLLRTGAIYGLVTCNVMGEESKPVGLFRRGDVVEHRASGQRFVVVESLSDDEYMVDAGVLSVGPVMYPGYCLRLASQLESSRSATESVSLRELVKQDRDNKVSSVERDSKAWNLSTKKDGTYDG